MLHHKHVVCEGVAKLKILQKHQYNKTDYSGTDPVMLPEVAAYLKFLLSLRLLYSVNDQI